MTTQIVRILFLAALAFNATAASRQKRAYGSSGASSSSYASASSGSSAGHIGGGIAGGIACAFIGQAGLPAGDRFAGYNTNPGSIQSSGGHSARSGNGALGASGGPGSHAGYGSASALSSSSAGSYGGHAASPPSNAIPAGNFGTGYPGYGAEAGPGGGGFQKNGAFPSNLPQGCFAGFPNYGSDPYQIHQQIMNQIQQMHEENLRFGSQIGGGSSLPHTGQHNYHYAHTNHWVSRDPVASQLAIRRWLAYLSNSFWYPYFEPASFYYNPWNYHRYYNRFQNGPAAAFASGTLGPQGGFGSAGVSPPDPGSLFLRFGDPAPNTGPIGSISGNIPPPSGGTYGISTSSRSGSSTVNGQTTSYKDSEVTVNDNGKVTTYKARNP